MKLTRTVHTLGACAAIAVLAAGCSAGGVSSSAASAKSAVASASDSQTVTATPTADPATKAACQKFFGDPDYTDPQVYEVMAMGASALKIGGTNASLFDSAAADVSKTFAEVTPDVKDAAGNISQWLTTETAKGSDANVDDFHAKITSLASACASDSEGAAWESGAHTEVGTKPAELVCAEIAVKPSLFTAYKNGDVLTQNMFSTVGLSYSRDVDSSHRDTVQSVYDYLERERQLVNNKGVADALALMEKPFKQVLDGNSHDGLEEAMKAWAPACAAAGYQGSVEAPQDTTTSGTTNEGNLSG